MTAGLISMLFMSVSFVTPTTTISRRIKGVEKDVDVGGSVKESEEKVAAEVKALPSSCFLSLPLIFLSTCHGLRLKMSDDMFFISVKKRFCGVQNLI